MTTNGLLLKSLIRKLVEITFVGFINVIELYYRVSNWPQNVIVLPGNRVEFSLETASLYAQDPHSNRFGFKCLVVGYDNPTTVRKTYFFINF